MHSFSSAVLENSCLLFSLKILALRVERGAAGDVLRLARISERR